MSEALTRRLAFRRSALFGRRKRSLEAGRRAIAAEFDRGRQRLAQEPDAVMSVSPAPTGRSAAS